MELSYRTAAVQGAGPIGLIIALYDRMCSDMRRASAAVRAGDIERRCAELNHAALVLGRLESWVAPGSDDPLAKSLVMFYGFLRAKMMEASLRQSAALLEELVELVVQVRSAWQQRELASVRDAEPAEQVGAVNGAAAPVACAQRTLSQTA